jgi:hypothetical protein
MTKGLFLKALVKFLAGLILVGLLVFLPAGTVAFFNGWLIMGILFVPMFVAGIVMMFKNPQLLEKRLNAKEKEEESLLDNPLLLAAGAAVLIAVVAVILWKRQKPQAAQPAPQQEQRQDMTVSVEALKQMPQQTVKEYRLVGLEGQFAGRRIALDRPLRLGRHPGCELSFASNTVGVSTLHCTLSPQAEGVVLTDNGSSYGTYLANGTKLTPKQGVTLRTGDVFYLADKRQMFQIDRKYN